MVVQKIGIEIPADILLALNSNENELGKEMKLAIAIRLYIKEKLTLGKAAELAGLSRYEFEESLTDNGIPISNLTFEDILKDIKKIN